MDDAQALSQNSGRWQPKIRSLEAKPVAPHAKAQLNSISAGIFAPSISKSCNDLYLLPVVTTALVGRGVHGLRHSGFTAEE